MDCCIKEEELNDFVYWVFIWCGVEMKNGDMKLIIDDIVCMDIINFDNFFGVNNVKIKIGWIDGKWKLVFYFDIWNMVFVVDLVIRVFME